MRFFQLSATGIFPQQQSTSRNASHDTPHLTGYFHGAESYFMDQLHGVGSLFMFRRLINISQWGYALRFSIATVVVFWTFVEVMGRWNAFHEIWVEPMTYQSEMITIFLAFIVLVTFLWYKSIKNKKTL